MIVPREVRVWHPAIDRLLKAQAQMPLLGSLPGSMVAGMAATTWAYAMTPPVSATPETCPWVWMDVFNRKTDIGYYFANQYPETRLTRDASVCEGCVRKIQLTFPGLSVQNVDS